MISVLLFQIDIFAWNSYILMYWEPILTWADSIYAAWWFPMMLWGQKAVVFAHHIRVLDRLCRVMDQMDSIRIDGTTPSITRQSLIRKFMSKTGPSLAIIGVTACVPQHDGPIVSTNYKNFCAWLSCYPLLKSPPEGSSSPPERGP